MELRSSRELSLGEVDVGRAGTPGARLRKFDGNRLSWEGSDLGGSALGGSMINRFLLSVFLLAWSVSPFSSAQPGESNYSGSSSGSSYDRGGESWDWGSDEGGGGSSYLGVDIADVSAERLSELKPKEEHGAEVTMVDQDAPAGKAGLHEHDVIVSV